MLSPAHPLWLVGFRPFFVLACLAGAALPVAWILVFKGILPLPTPALSPVQWHAHEMFYGFGWAVLGGFLLTATKNWVGIRGYHGGILMALAAAWLLERVAMAFGASWPTPLVALATNLYIPGMVLLLIVTLVRHRSSDSYRRDNIFFLIALPLFLVAKALLLSPEHFNLGWSMTLGLFRIAFLVMLERTMVPFMRAAFQIELPRRPLVDNSIKIIAVALVPAPLLPPPLATALELLLAALLLARLASWSPFKALTRLDVGIMVLGYLAIAAQLLIEALPPPGATGWVGTVAVHVFTFGAMGLVIPAMIVRIANGHTGRKVFFGGPERAVLWMMMVAFVVRVVGPQLVPGAYLRWLDLAAACWLAGFALLAMRIAPLVFRPRVDGREH